jgi:membrane protein
MKAMMDALNVVYDVPEGRGLIRLNLVSLTLTTGAVVFLLLVIAIVVVFPLVMAFIGLESFTETVLRWSRWPVIVGLLLLALATLYRFGPSPHGAKWRWISPGAVLATILWLAGSALLSWYLSNFADYDATYGSLGAAIGMMMWMWISAIAVLFGAQLNAVLEQRAERAGAPDSLSAATAATPREAASG